MSEHYLDYKKQAHKELQISIELINKTYVLSKDPKVLVSALHHLKDAQDACIQFIMYLENKPFDVESFIQLSKEKQNLTQNEQQTIIDVHQLCQHQKDSDVEFRRKESYVLCDDTYNLTTLTQKKLIKYLEQTITLIQKILR